VVDKATGAKLKVLYFRPFRSNHWIIDEIVGRLQGRGFDVAKLGRTPQGNRKD